MSAHRCASRMYGVLSCSSWWPTTSNCHQAQSPRRSSWLRLLTWTHASPSQNGVTCDDDGVITGGQCDQRRCLPYVA